MDRRTSLSTRLYYVQLLTMRRWSRVVYDWIGEWGNEIRWVSYEYAFVFALKAYLIGKLTIYKLFAIITIINIYRVFTLSQ